MSLRIIRDPVHNHILFDREADALILKLLDTPEVQRLRRIRQLGVGNLVYPGAEHSRFSHSLGVWHVANAAMTFLERNEQVTKLPELRRSAVSAAALLHDIGHGPLSHVLEDDFGGDHEQRTRDLISDPTTSVYEVLKEVDPTLPGLVVAIFEGQDPELLWLRALVTSQLDVDRMDYLLRDSHFCGVGYGQYDYHYILHTMRLREVPPKGLLQPVWLHKACRVIEEYLFARYYMLWNVYHHKTTKGYEELLKAVCSRAADVLRNGCRLPADDVVAKFVKAETMSNSEHQALDDHMLLQHIAHWRSSDDEILADLCRRFLSRGGLKPIECVASDMSPFQISGAITEIRKTLDDAGFDSKYYLRQAGPSSKTYDYYHPEKETGERTATTSILVEHGGGVAEISTVPGMDRLRAVTGKADRRQWLYVPEEFRQSAREKLARG